MKINLSKTSHAWKPTVIPEGFEMVIDTREQKPLFQPCLFNNRHKALKHGDYSIVGFENQITIELKRMGDLMSYIGKERLKTKKKLEHMSQMFFAALVVLESESDILSPWKVFTQITPEQVRGFLTSLNVRYGIHFYCNRNRGELERWILDRLVKSYNVLREGD